MDIRQPKNEVHVFFILFKYQTVGYNGDIFGI